jgi:hypothetical protein
LLGAGPDDVVDGLDATARVLGQLREHGQREGLAALSWDPSHNKLPSPTALIEPLNKSRL